MDLVTGALGSVISKLGELIKEEINLQWGLRNEITRLKGELEYIHEALFEMVQVPLEELDKLTRLWVRDVRELSYDVEVILDTFLVRVDSCNTSDPNWFNHVAQKISNLFSKTKVHHQIDGMIKSINKQAKEITSRRDKYKVGEIVSKPAAPRTIDPRLKAMYTEVTQLVGIEKPSDEVISLLSPLGDGENKMVSVVGTGGLGKTTLAKAVYDKLKVSFTCTAFVPVGRGPDLKKVFIDILIELNKDKYTDPKYRLLDENQLTKELREYLEEKRYFIVIDDIWNIGTWKSIKPALVKNNNGSRVITTTRHCDVADQVGEVYRLEPLPRHQSEKLFYTRVFGAEETCPNHLKEVADKILNKCDGVPLAVITMASLLVGKTQGEWIEVSNSIVFGGKKKNQEVSDTEWILSLSYYDLPPHLKSCLLYLSAYPEDYVIEKVPLIWMWVAEGFVVDKEPGTRLYEVGEGYFNELINRSMIQALESSEYKGTIDACCIHDMVLDLIRVKSQEENFFTILSTDVEGTSSTCKVRRLSCQTHACVKPTHLDITRMRTFVSFVDWPSNMDFQNFKFLRVLHLEDANKEVDVENLLHLRYLRGTQFKIQGIGGLKFLKILDLEHAEITELPLSLGLLTQLICLRVGSATVPNGIIEKLTSLQELQILGVENGMAGQFVMDLGNLLELRALDVMIGISESIVTSNLVKTLGKLHKLQHLELQVLSSVNEAISKLGLLPRPLQIIAIYGLTFAVLPSCINPSDLPNLTRLELDVSFMDKQSLRILGGLPELRHLHLFLESTASINVPANDDDFFRKLISLTVPCSTVHFALNEDGTISFTLWQYKDAMDFGYFGSDEDDVDFGYFGFDEDDVDFGSAEKGEKCTVRAPGVMPNLQVLHFKVQVVGLVRNKSSCDRLGLEYLPSLQEVKVYFLCEDASGDDEKRQKAALWHAVKAHPNRPTLKII